MTRCGRVTAAIRVHLVIDVPRMFISRIDAAFGNGKPSMMQLLLVCYRLLFILLTTRNLRFPRRFSGSDLVPGQSPGTRDGSGGSAFSVLRLGRTMVLILMGIAIGFYLSFRQFGHRSGFRVGVAICFPMILLFAIVPATHFAMWAANDLGIGWASPVGLVTGISSTFISCLVAGAFGNLVQWIIYGK